MATQRKLKLFLLCLVVFIAALFLGKISGTEFYQGIIALYACFAVGNGAEHIGKSK